MGISFWSQPPWPSYLQIGQPWLCLITSIELTASRLAAADPQVGRSAFYATTRSTALKADGSHQDPSVLPEVFFWWKFLVNFRILWTQKKATQKQTHFRDLQMVAFSVWMSEETAEQHFDGMEAAADWKFWAFSRVGFGAFFLWWIMA